MPRRRALTSEQLADLYALPAAEPDLVRYWTLSADDLAAIERRRGGANQLGFALQLCAFRYPGRLLRPGEVGALSAYARRPQTRREQLDALRVSFGFRTFAQEHQREFLTWL